MTSPRIALSVALLVAASACRHGVAHERTDASASDVGLGTDAAGSDLSVGTDAAYDAGVPRSSATGCFPSTAGWPLAGGSLSSIQDSYAYRTNADIHSGVDLPTPPGTPARAILPGDVVEVRRMLDCGHEQIRVTVAHPGDGCTFHSVYNHLDATSVAVGDPVGQGDVVGSTNYNCDPAFPHLHFELRLGCRLSACAVHPLRALPYAYDPGVQPSVHILSIDVAASTYVVEVVVPRLQPDFVRIVCDHARGGVTTTSYYDLEEAHAGTVFPNVTVDVDPYGLADPAQTARYAFMGPPLAAGDELRCYARNIQGDDSPSALATVP